MAFEVIGSVVKIKSRVVLAESQKWSLIAPINVPEINFIGNPCTSFFNDGKCTQCTGDCDSDSDCAGDLRCAQRRQVSGVENVPGCAWGATSNPYTDDDYCKYVS